jgi:UDP:flavonoid glycosyltransferase YjiC (YdhE family)
MNEEKLSAAIDKMINDVEMRHQAAGLGTKIRSEDGVTRAVECIEWVHEKLV